MNKTKKQVLTTERNDITPILGVDWMKKFLTTIRNNRLAGMDQSEKGKVVRKLFDLFINNTTIKGAAMKVELKSGHYPVKKRAIPIPPQLQQSVGANLRKSVKSGHLKKV